MCIELGFGLFEFWNTYFVQSIHWEFANSDYSIISRLFLVLEKMGSYMYGIFVVEEHLPLFKVSKRLYLCSVFFFLSIMLWKGHKIMREVRTTAWTLSLQCIHFCVGGLIRVQSCLGLGKFHSTWLLVQWLILCLFTSSSLSLECIFMNQLSQKPKLI